MKLIFLWLLLSAPMTRMTALWTNLKQMSFCLTREISCGSLLKSSPALANLMSRTSPLTNRFVVLTMLRFAWCILFCFVAVQCSAFDALLYCTTAHFTVLFYTVLSCTTLYCTVSTVLYCSVLSCIVLFCSVFFSSLLFSSVLFCSVLYSSLLFSSLLFSSLLFSSVLFCAVLCCATLHLACNAGVPVRDEHKTAVGEGEGLKNGEGKGGEGKVFSLLPLTLSRRSFLGLEVWIVIVLMKQPSVVPAL